VVTDTRNGGVHAAASVCEIGRRGFRLAWATSDGKMREVPFVALGAHAAPSSSALRLLVTRLVAVAGSRKRSA